MKVFVVEVFRPYDSGGGVDSVYSTLERAEQRVAELKRNPYLAFDYSISEMEVDKCED